MTHFPLDLSRRLLVSLWFLLLFTSCLISVEVVVEDGSTTNVVDVDATAQFLPRAHPNLKDFELNLGQSFPVRKFNKVTLFQDAHVGEDLPPNIHRDPNFVVNDAWSQIYNSIRDAKHFIYITGWSLATSISLLRRINTPEDEIGVQTPLGELLKQKADQGVRVLILLWNDHTSIGVGNEATPGQMKTHDEETREFFQDSKVTCILAYRCGSFFGSFEWTHHQKSVILDAEFPGLTKRQIVAYVGGLDLTDGRWDSPKHSLFRTLRREHEFDFHHPWTDVTQDLGPREPWHDIHSKLEGPVANDVRANFEQRWLKQAPEELHPLLFTILHDEFIQYPEDPLQPPTDYPPFGTWSVQFFRSIDSYSAIGVEDTEKSIQLAYLNAIAASRRFLYIENQYFMGSSFAWTNHHRVGANQRIPYEIALHIASRIAKKEDYAVYIVVPMYPEGEPSSDPVQTMLVWQWNTMEMMYQIIAKAIKENGLEKEKHPRDYLNFYCLGNRETTQDAEDDQNDDDNEDEEGRKIHMSRRFMIYVHAKMLIADDAYIIVGSANINERSMAGNRDTELAMGAYEERESDAELSDIHQFRLNLWGEHLETSRTEFLFPENPATVHLVNELAEANWQKYVSDSVFEMDTGHLMPYPILVDSDGTLTPRVEFFPDTQASVRGSVAFELPYSMTA